MAASTKCLNLKRPWPLSDITPFSYMQKIEVTGTSNLASLFYTKGGFGFCIALLVLLLKTSQLSEMQLIQVHYKGVISY